MIQLRDYQREAVDSLSTYFEHHDGHPLIVLPTGAGKTVVLATFVKEVLQQWPGQRIVLLTHVRELIAQGYEKIKALWPQAPAGIYSAGLGRKDVGYPIAFCGIQSVHAKARAFGHVDLVIIDEAHLVAKKAEGMYRSFIADLTTRNPLLKVVGLTATPYRLKGGLLHVGDDRLFTDIAYECDILRLIDAGFLCRLVPKRVDGEIDTTNVHSRGGEFVASELEAAANSDAIVKRAVDEIVRYGTDRRSWLVFCCGVKHARHVADEIRARGVTVGLVLGDTPTAERDAMIADYKAGRLRCLVNVGVLTTGFDAPETDLLAVLRPTESPGLWSQMCGRGLRPAPTKADCVVLDFGRNVERHGPIDAIRAPGSKGSGEPGEPMTKTCPDCATKVFIAAATCPECGYEFPVSNTPKHDPTASTAALLSTDEEPEVLTVRAVHYRHHKKAGKPDSLRVDYVCEGFRSMVSEWICLMHTGYARYKAEAWWMRRSGEAREWVPDNIEDAIDLARGLRTPTHITTRRDGDYVRITHYHFDAADDEAPADAEHARSLDGQPH